MSGQWQLSKEEGGGQMRKCKGTAGLLIPTVRLEIAKLSGGGGRGCLVNAIYRDLEKPEFNHLL